jgi:hypothetical protein
LAGYGAISFGFLKVSWLSFGVHFYWSGLSHDPQAPIIVDLILISILIVGGIYLVLLREIIAALLIIFVVCLFEAAFLHSGPHQLMQLSVIVLALIGQATVLLLNFMLIISPERRNHRKQV